MKDPASRSLFQRSESSGDKPRIDQAGNYDPVLGPPRSLNSAYLSSVRDVKSRIAELCASSDEISALPGELIDLMTDAKLFAMFMPKSLGGLEVDLITGLQAIEEVAAADSTAGWLVVKCAWSNMLAARLPPDVAREIWTTPESCLAGTIAPKGAARAVKGGYSLSGRWEWGTGSQFATWIMAAAVIVDDAGKPLQTPAGPERRIMLVPKAACSIIDTWHTYGMRGTASNDFACADLFVPERFAIEIDQPGPKHPVYDQAPYMAQIMLPHASLAIGAARGCIEALCDLAMGKMPLMSRTLLKDKEWVQDAVGRATAIVRSARAYLYESVQAMFEAEAYDATIGLHLSLAATHATHECIRAVDLMTRAAGGTAVYLSSPIQKYFRDLHVAASHAAVNVERYAGAGRVVFGDSPSPLM